MSITNAQTYGLGFSSDPPAKDAEYVAAEMAHQVAVAAARAQYQDAINPANWKAFDAALKAADAARQAAFDATRKKYNLP